MTLIKFESRIPGNEYFIIWVLLCGFMMSPNNTRCDNYSTVKVKFKLGKVFSVVWVYYLAFQKIQWNLFWHWCYLRIYLTVKQKYTKLKFCNSIYHLSIPIKFKANNMNLFRFKVLFWNLTSALEFKKNKKVDTKRCSTTDAISRLIPVGLADGEPVVHVLAVGARVRELLEAFAALEGLLTSVEPLVFRQVMFVFESLRAF